MTIDYIPPVTISLLGVAIRLELQRKHFLSLAQGGDEEVNREIRAALETWKRDRAAST
jgi:hypothetical protein